MAEQALEGVKVADFGWAGVGPLVASHLASHGAQVIHIESRKAPDVLRLGAPFKDGVPGINRSGFFANCNSNKYGITLNLGHPRGIELAKRIIGWSDIVIENFSPRVMAKWGLDYDALSREKDGLIMVRSNMQGISGPHASFRAYGLVLQALAGFSHLTGWPDREPVGTSIAYTDFIAPPYAVAAIMAGLDYRQRTGRGLLIDLSQFETALQFLAPVLLDCTTNNREQSRVGNRDPYAAPHGAFPCRGEDRWCAIAIFTDEEWQLFCGVTRNRALGEDRRFATLADRKANEDELETIVADWTIRFPCQEVMESMQSVGIAAGVVQSGADLHEDPQLQHRHHFWRLDHAEMGACTYDGAAYSLLQNPYQLNMPAPCLGEHNEYVYTKIIGLSDDEFVRCMQDGVFE